MKKNRFLRTGIIVLYVVFIAVSWIIGFDAGKEISRNFGDFALEMLKLLPCAFILIGLFEVWVRKETVEKHLGERAGIRGYLWAILLAGTNVGGLYVAFPIAYSLYRKGAKLSVIFTYISASAVLRIPMAVFEASFLGIKFTLIRMLVSVPLIIISSIILGNYLTKKNFEMKEGK
ncbi:MAG: permease [Dehalococcoidales bacterium]|nr:permease [Dehalococcoidales bacterium]